MAYVHAHVHMHIGVSDMLARNPELTASVDSSDEDKATKTSCSKDTGGKTTLHKWTRGHLFNVHGGGHIDTWQPLYE